VPIPKLPSFVKMPKSKKSLLLIVGLVLNQRPPEKVIVVPLKPAPKFN